MLKKDNYNQSNTSHVTIKELIKRMQLYRPNIKTFYKKKNKPSSKILASTQAQSQEVIKKFMRKRKSKRKEESNDNTKNILHGCFILSEEPKRLLEISLPPLTREDAALEAFRHNPTDGSFAPPAARPSA